MYVNEIMIVKNIICAKDYDEIRKNQMCGWGYEMEYSNMWIRKAVVGNNTNMWMRLGKGIKQICG